MIVASVDPSSKQSAFVVLDMSARPRLLEWAKLDRPALVARLMDGGFDALTIELVEGVAFDPARARDLIASERGGGVAEGFALAMGWRHHLMTARKWRGDWLGFPTASDKAIRIAVEATIDLSGDFPRIYADDRPDVYDAIGTAIASAAHLGLPRVGIPTATRAAIDAEMRAVRAGASKKRKATMAARKAAS